MKDTETLSSAAEAALQQGEERLSACESRHRMQLPPPYPFRYAAEAMLRSYFFALMSTTHDPDLYSEILQHFLVEHSIPFPRGVFRRTFFQVQVSSLEGGSKPLLRGRMPGRPKKQEEAWSNLLLWDGMGRPSFGRLAQELDPSLKGTELKKRADCLRQQVRSILPREKKKP